MPKAQASAKCQFQVSCASSTLPVNAGSYLFRSSVLVFLLPKAEVQHPSGIRSVCNSCRPPSGSATKERA